MKKKSRQQQAETLPLFTTAELEPQFHTQRSSATGAGYTQGYQMNTDEHFGPAIDAERQPVYKELTAQEMLVHLNAPQRQAVSTTQGPVLILAGPGSGKTRVITHRIAYLVQHHQVPPTHILAVTFTNKAANEMRERLENMIGVKSREVVVTTFHSLCARMLRRSREFLLRFGLTPSFSIADEHDQERLISAVMKAPGIDLHGLDDNQKSAGALCDLISRAKGDLQTPDMLERQAEQKQKISLKIVGQVFREYDRLLRKNGLLDFEDLLTFTVFLLQSDEDARSYYQHRWRYIHVDEFQDTNTPQYQIVRLLGYGTDAQATGHRNVCVVGDDDQMIYTWRGASMENLERFDRDFPERIVIYLEQNYRSSKTIVEAASAVVKANTYRRAKNLWTANDQGNHVIVAETESPEDEAQYVMEEISRLHRIRQIKAWSDVAILYRTNAQSEAIEEMALQFSLPYQIVGATMFYQRKEVKDFLAYIRVLLNPRDDLSLERIINVPARGIGKVTVTTLKEWAIKRDLSLYQALSRLSESTVFDKAARSALSQFWHTLTALQQAIDTLSLPDALDAIAQMSGVEHMLRNGSEEQQERWENFQEIKRVAAHFAGAETARALFLFLEHVTLMSGADTADPGKQVKQEVQETRDVITLMTLHSAKGLEFPVVFLIGVEEGLLPMARTALEAPNPEGIEEERRLLYVGMTRAKHRLYCVRARQRMRNGKLHRPGPSRFLDALPLHLTKTFSWQ